MLVQKIPRLALIIDDDPYIYSLISILIRDLNFITVHADNIAKARIFTARTCPDVIFIDQRLPDGFGLELIPGLRKDFPLAKIIAITAEDVEENKLRVKEYGADYFLEKPFTVKKIREILE